MATPNVLDPECEFVAEVPEKFKCMICMKILSEPHLTECCGQHFCKSCLENWLKRNPTYPTCPHCRKENPKHILNKGREREIKELEIYCKNNQAGCQWKGRLEDFGTHQSGCLHNEVKCAGCGQVVRRREMNSHLQKECPSRQYECKHCKQHRDTYRAITKPGGHYETCPNSPVKCPLECGKTVQRKDMQNHISGGECQIGSTLHRTTDCTNGCGQQMKGKDLSEHLRNECLLRMYKCEHCGYEKTYLAVTNHYKACNNYPLQCLIGCGAAITRKDVTAHQNECPHIKISCPKGCGAAIMRKDVTAHQNECPHIKISCPKGCGAAIMRKDVTAHQNECPHVKISCPKGCGAAIMRKDVTGHQNECPHVKISCPKGCGAAIMRKDVTGHQNECPHVKISCPKGCGAAIMRKDVTAHQNECLHVKISCPNGCGAAIMRKDVTAHQNECPHVEINCLHFEAVVISRERIRNHECIELRPLEVRSFIYYCMFVKL